MTNEEVMAVVTPAVCAQLKSPASAQFHVEMISIVGDDSRGHHVDGFVDSQNGYGTMTKSVRNGGVAVHVSLTISERLKDIRTERGLDIAEVAKAGILISAVFIFFRRLGRNCSGIGRS